MLERIIITATIIGLGTLAYAGGLSLQKRRVRAQAATSPLLRDLNPGIPAILYFWSEMCVPCKTVQEPALERLEAALGQDGIRVIAIDAIQNVELADQWSVMSTPTTIVLDGMKQPRFINNRPAPFAELLEQVTTL